MIDIYTRNLAKFDVWMVLLVVGLMCFGLIIIGSATRISLLGSSPAFDNQLIFMIFGVAILIASAVIDYRFIARFYIPIYILCISLLLFVAIFGEDWAGVRRWVSISIGGFSFGIQASEFTKVFMIIFLAKLLDTHRDINNPGMLAALAGMIMLPVGLIAMQPSLSAAVVVLVICVSILFVSNVGGKSILVALAIATPIVSFLVYDFGRDESILIHHIVQDYQRSRIETLLNPQYATADDTFQIERSLQAIGSGQFSGQGLHQGQITQSAGLPAAETDFIISVIGEELGFVGVMGVLTVMFMVVMKCFWAAIKAPDTLGRLICIGVTVKLAFQTFANVGVVTEILPNTGVPFPFVSYGGSSLWTSLAAVGLVINVSMTKAKSIFQEIRT